MYVCIAIITIIIIGAPRRMCIRFIVHLGGGGGGGQTASVAAAVAPTAGFLAPCRRPPGPSSMMSACVCVCKQCGINLGQASRARAEDVSPTTSVKENGKMG